MDKIRRKVSGLNKIFPVYHYKEVDDLKYKHWKDVIIKTTQHQNKNKQFNNCALLANVLDIYRCFY